MIEYRWARPEDAAVLNLCSEDQHELAHYRAPSVTLIRKAIEDCPGNAGAALINGRVEALWGYKVRGKLVSPWLLASDAARAHPRAFLTAGRHFMGAMREFRRAGLKVYNQVGRHCPRNQRFLKHLGFVIEPGDPDSPFQPFYLP